MAPSTYFAAKSRRPSARVQRDAVMDSVVRQLWEENCRVYGAKRVWTAAQRAGDHVGRDQVARLMDAEGIEGVQRTKTVCTTRPNPRVPTHVHNSELKAP